VPAARLGDHEPHSTDGSHEEGGDDVRIAVGAAAALDDAVGEPDQRRQGGELADGSKEWSRRGDSGTRVSTARATPPTGRLMKKMMLQSSSVSRPPTMGPAAAATDPPSAQ